MRPISELRHGGSVFLKPTAKRDTRVHARPDPSMRTLAFLVLICAFALSGCRLDQKDKKKAAKKPVLQESSEVDFQGFLVRLRKAAKARDTETLVSMMTGDFGYSLNPEASGAGVFQYWDENNLWPELDGILGERFVKKGEFMVAPPQFADDTSGYDGYRAGIVRVNGSWKFAYFVNG